ncbi:hypothetical protein PIB30_019746 [Stylosanthes scabra]|uniref:Uncharacterized protein n=1 Tax=Stylosanthes scabra TaxID=79078 RepID=A0ABU6W6M2_9FABA|nr:hypothetical protein [Stylosanthes scabra]
MFQGITNQPTQVQLLAPSPLPSQPISNPKGGINAFQNKDKKKMRDGDERKEGSARWWYELLAQLADSDDEEEEDDDNSDEEDDEEEEEDETKGKEEEESEDESDEEDNDDSEEEEDEKKSSDMDKTFFVATLFSNKRVKEEIPVKCEDPSPCLVTCRIKDVIVRECLCDPGACSSVMPYELYKFLGLGPLKETKDIFTTVDASVVSVVGIAEDVLTFDKAETDKARIKCSSLSKLFRKLKGLKRLLHQKKRADAHLVRNNSKWK